MTATSTTNTINTNLPIAVNVFLFLLALCNGSDLNNTPIKYLKKDHGAKQTRGGMLERRKTNTRNEMPDS